MKPIEKLAREICWLGFTTPASRAGKTKASYWKRLPEETHQSYIIEAQHFTWLLSELSDDMLNLAHAIQKKKSHG
jgi:hypothetical protein